MEQTLQPPTLTLSLRARLIILSMVLLGLFLAAMDQTIVSTALPRIIAQLNGLSLYSWVFTAYMLASTTVVPIAGKLSDIHGRKRFFLGGILLFLFASACAGLSQSMLQLIIFRGIQGLGAGTIMASAFAMIGDLFAPRERGRYQGLMGASFGLASIIGPLLGGLLTDHLSWRWVFYVNLPLGIIIFPVLWRLLPSFHYDQGKRSVDYLGAITLAAAIVPLLLALVWGGNEFPWSSPVILSLLSAALIMTGVFLVVERRAKEPLIPLTLFQDRVFTVAVLIVFLTGIAMFGSIAFIPLFMQGALGTSATNSGVILMPMTLGLVIGSTLSGQIVSRTGRYRYLSMAGLAIATTGIFLLSQMSVHTSRTEAVTNMMIIGFGLGITMPLFVLATQNALPYQMLGVVTAAIQFFRSVGGTFGIAILGSFLTHRITSEFGRELPPDIRQTVPAPLLDRLTDPQVLLNPQALNGARAAFAQIPNGPALFAEVVTALRASLGTALHDVFLVTALISLTTIVANLFLKEIPLRHGYDTATIQGKDDLAPAAAHPDPPPLGGDETALGHGAAENIEQGLINPH